jgi:hypothetical protein
MSQTMQLSIEKSFDDLMLSYVIIIFSRIINYEFIYHCFKNKQYILIIKELFNKLCISIETNCIFYLVIDSNWKPKNLLENIFQGFFALSLWYLFIHARVPRWLQI